MPDERTIASGDTRATVVVLGGGLGSLTVNGRELLDGDPPGATPSDFRGQPVAPWPNRVIGGSYAWDGRQLQLPLNEPAPANALHGLVSDVQWSLVDARADRVTLEVPVPSQPGYPFEVVVAVTYSVAPGGVTVVTTARNVGTQVAPLGVGHHPYLRPASSVIDECTLTLDAAAYLPADERGAPGPVAPVDATRFDLRGGRRIGSARIDNTFTDLARDAEGRAWMTMTDPAGGGAALWLEEPYRYVQVYTGDTLPVVARRRLSVAVEPMTCPPNALQSGVDLLTLEPGESVTLRWGLEAIS